MNTFNRYSLLLVLIIFSACNNKFTEQPTDPNDLTLNDLEISPNFDWENTQDAKVTIFTKDNAGNAVPNVKVSIWTNFEEENGVEIINGATDNQGEFKVDYNFEADMEEVVLKTDFIGFIPEAKVPIENGNIYFTFGGTRDSQKNQNAGSKSFYSKVDRTLKSKFSANININYLGSYDGNGVPDYLEDEGDYISPEFLNDVNAALPENRPVPTYHPEYLVDGNEQNIVVLEEAEVWVTFVSEGAGYRNVLAYYTYDRDFPPTTTADIKDCYVIFPNVSFQGSGGGLYSGDKVSLGTFQKNTVIGWMLMRDGWNGPSQQSTEGRGLLYSNSELNPEPDVEHQQHTVLLLDKERDVILISFEDLIRPGGDNDFNDAVFYATANPIENIEIENIQIANPDPIDTDEDGINDSFDDYPEDPNLAFNNYFASSGLYGTLAFEDQWPSKGDYDFNDLVIDYNFNRISNAANKVVTLQGKFIVRAIGASFQNGFGFTIEGLNPSLIESVSGTQYTEGYIQNNANGTEAGQSSATIIVFDNAWKHGFGNTTQNEPYRAGDTITVNINLVNPIDADEFGMAPFNPFIIVNKERGREVHLANYPPTDLADLSYFGESSDDTQPAAGKYYKTEQNLPWAINFPSKFEYPIEKVSIELSHLKFVPWVLSEGLEYNNWYKNETDFRKDANIYQEQ
ncbi:LruC domain-containing protein [Polaribacter litorisediminis]|uniref:LruC domain-containing protein n=1 Tax=Polaribacter litorisediminis TaxID=1908341 RepID=UPI001CC07587|nr:LruC domain-containing protein [Polaribacter litorisediminis]UAM99751.1 LruC domain-containing protein [Polaribacter litorisediminis]